jgi:hypothetical protein
LNLCGSWSEAEFFSELANHRGEDFAIGLKRRLFRAEFEVSIELEQSCIVHFLCVGRQNAMKNGKDTGFPLNQGSVAIEGEDLEAAEVDHGVWVLSQTQGSAWG